MGGGANGKQVFFIGAWRAQQFSDQLLRQISSQIANKKGYLTHLTITTEGLELRMHNVEGKVTRHDKIALENIVDFIDNKYNTTCTLAIVRDKQQKIYTVFVFICKSDKDAAELIQLFKTTKGQLSGEGYNFDLTPKGHNWMLQEKSEPAVQRSVNGEVRVYADNPLPNGNIPRSDHPDGGNNMTSTDSHSRASVKSSSSEVREEISQLAGEVRDIKRLLEASQGRAKFENHYGYRINPGQKSPMIPVTSSTQFIEREVRVQQAPKTIVYTRNNNNYIRYPDGSTRVIVKKGTVPRSTRNRHVLALSPTRAGYTKRVYESKNPYIETAEVRRQPVQQVRYVTQQPQPPILMHRLRGSRGSSHGSYRSDVVHKSIENVYRSRPSRRMYLPPQPMSPVSPTFPAEVIYANEVREPKLLHPRDALVQRQVNGNTVHVKLDPEIRTFYENDGHDDDDFKASNASNVSTNVNTSVNDDLDDKMRQIESSYNLANEQNVIVVENNEISRSAPEGEAHVVRVESHDSVHEDQSNVVGGDVYHVKAEYADNYEREPRMNGGVFIVQSNSERHHDDYETEPRHETVVYNEREVVARETNGDDDDDNNSERIDDGLFESYVKKPEEKEQENTSEIVEETAVRYHEDDIEVEIIERERSDQVKAEANNDDDEQEIPENEDDGLFGAYTKTPEEFDKPKRTVIAERAFRYHDQDDEKSDDTEADTEKRVRYNDTVEHIPAAGSSVPVDIEERNMQATYEADQPIETTETEFGWGSAVSDRVNQLNKQSSVTSDREEDGEEEEEYHLDMDALRAYSNDPDLVIIESNESTAVRAVTRDIDRVSINEEAVTDVTDDVTDTIKTNEFRRPSVDVPDVPDVPDVIPDEIEDSPLPERVKLPVTQDDLKEYAAKKMERSSIQDDVVDEITNRAENTVLF